MKKNTLIFIIILAVICSCQIIPADEEAPHSVEIKTLDEMPLEQLRVFLKGYSGDWRSNTPEKGKIPSPPIQKTYPENSTLIDLVKPENIKAGNMPLAKVINQRRSRRSFAPDCLSQEELSFLLWSTQGISKIEKDDEGNIAYHFRTVPSGGARHPFETYLIINRVEGVAPGLYRYLAIEHKLLLMREDKDLPQKITDACYGQKFMGESAAVFIWSAIPFRTEWRYGFIAHKMIAVEAGHVCQNLYLAAESIGGGACALLGYNQNKLNQLIEADGKDEFAVYLAAVGRIKPEDR